MDNNDITEIKKITEDDDNKRVIVIQKVARDRMITNENSWELNEDDYDSNKQYKILIKENTDDIIFKLMDREIKKKISGYRCQDRKKNKYNEAKFIDDIFITNKLLDSSFNCYYCRCNVLVLYKTVRAPNQWSVERLNNDFGHNKDNIVIACLSCNLRRKTMYHERFRFTKQVKIIKK